MNFPHLTANVKKNRFALFGNGIAEKRQHRQLVEIHNTDKVIIVQYVHTVYETVRVGEADGVLGTSSGEDGQQVYTLNWESNGIAHTVMGDIPYDEIIKIAESIR